MISIGQQRIKLKGRTDHYSVHKVLNNHLSNTGKMMRPKLIEKFGKIFQLSDTDQQLIARSAEMIHTASLIHDDVVDEAETRRNQKTLHKKTSNSMAVLAGDFLLARVIGDLVTAGQFEILRTISQALEDIVEGEFLQDQFKKSGTNTKEELIEVSKKKTGALMAWCCSSVAILANAEKDIVKKSHEVGEKIGIAFQMMDDNLDFSDITGKDKYKDLKDGLINFTTLNLLKKYPEIYYTVHQMRGSNFHEVPWNEKQILEAIEETSRDASQKLNEAQEAIFEIAKSTQAIDHINVINELIEFINLMKARVK